MGLYYSRSVYWQEDQIEEQVTPENGLKECSSLWAGLIMSSTRQILHRAIDLSREMKLKFLELIGLMAEVRRYRAMIWVEQLRHVHELNQIIFGNNRKIAQLVNIHAISLKNTARESSRKGFFRGSRHTDSKWEVKAEEAEICCTTESWYDVDTMFQCPKDCCECSFQDQSKLREHVVQYHQCADNDRITTTLENDCENLRKIFCSTSYAMMFAGITNTFENDCENLRKILCLPSYAMRFAELKRALPLPDFGYSTELKRALPLPDFGYGTELKRALPLPDFGYGTEPKRAVPLRLYGYGTGNTTELNNTSAISRTNLFSMFCAMGFAVLHNSGAEEYVARGITCSHVWQNCCRSPPDTCGIQRVIAHSIPDGNVASLVDED